MKSVIEKLSLSGLTATTKELIKELKEEIVKQTYFIDGPPAVKQPAKKKVKTVEPEVKMNLNLKSKHQQLMCHLIYNKISRQLFSFYLQL